MAAVHGALDELQTGLQFRHLALIIVKAQGRVAADLAQSGELCQNQKFVFVKLLLILPGNFLTHVNHLPVIEPLLLCGKTHVPAFL